MIAHPTYTCPPILAMFDVDVNDSIRGSDVDERESIELEAARCGEGGPAAVIAGCSLAATLSYPNTP